MRIDIFNSHAFLSLIPEDGSVELSTDLSGRVHIGESEVPRSVISVHDPVSTALKVDATELRMSLEESRGSPDIYYDPDDPSSLHVGGFCIERRDVLFYRFEDVVNFLRRVLDVVSEKAIIEAEDMSLDPFYQQSGSINGRELAVILPDGKLIRKKNIDDFLLAFMEVPETGLHPEQVYRAISSIYASCNATQETQESSCEEIYEDFHDMYLGDSFDIDMTSLSM